MIDSLSGTRHAVLARLVCKASDQKLGRTQVMKLFYFLQELKGAPLAYDFRLFTYGPFDSEVLSDLATATAVNTVSEKTVIFPQSYGFEITAGPHADRLSRELEVTFPNLASQVDTVLAHFGSYSAAELELRSTILFVDRELKQGSSATTTVTLIERVRQLKPHFSEEIIYDRVKDMADNGWLLSFSAPLRQFP